MSEEKSKENNKDNRKALFVGVGIIAIMVVLILVVTIQPWKKDSPDEGNNGRAADTISQEPTPTVTGGASRSYQPPKSTTIVDGDGNTSTRFSPPTGLGLPDDVEVDEKLAQNPDALYADPREAIKKTLTVPTTFRQEPNEAPDLLDPKYGTPDMLAKNFIQTTFNMCIKKDTSYAKRFKEASKWQVTKQFYDRGLQGKWTGAHGHNDGWDLYTREKRCMQLFSFPEIKANAVKSEDTIVYFMNIKQRVVGGNTKDVRLNIQPFKASVTMKFVGNKWLADDVTVMRDSYPKVY